jgi:hypothetical protein
MAQMVQCLPSKCTTLSSIPNTTKKQNKTKQKQQKQIAGRIFKLQELRELSTHKPILEKNWKQPTKR